MLHVPYKICHHIQVVLLLNNKIHTIIDTNQMGLYTILFVAIQ